MNLEWYWLVPQVPSHWCLFIVVNKAISHLSVPIRRRMVSLVKPGESETFEHASALNIPVKRFSRDKHGKMLKSVDRVEGSVFQAVLAQRTLYGRTYESQPQPRRLRIDGVLPRQLLSGHSTAMKVVERENIVVDKIFVFLMTLKSVHPKEGGKRPAWTLLGMFPVLQWCEKLQGTLLSIDSRPLWPWGGIAFPGMLSLAEPPAN